MNFCPNCGAALQNRPLPCAACGFSSPDPGGEAASVSASAARGRRRRVLLTAAIALSAVLLCVGGFFLFRLSTTPDYVRAAEASLQRDRELLRSIEVEVKTTRYLATYSTGDSYLAFFLVNPDAVENNVVAVELDSQRRVVPFGYSAQSVPKALIPDIRRGVAELRAGPVYHHSS